MPVADSSIDVRRVPARTRPTMTVMRAQTGRLLDARGFV
jgi:hypothetical protein